MAKVKVKIEQKTVPQGNIAVRMLNVHILEDMVIKAGQIIFLPHNFYSNLPQLTEMLYLLALVTRSGIAAKLLHFCFGLLSAAAIYAVAGKLWSRRIGALAGLALLLVIGMSLLLSNSIVKPILRMTLAMRRCEAASFSPNISTAVRQWMSSPLLKAPIITFSCAMCAAIRSSICE